MDILDEFFETYCTILVLFFSAQNAVYPIVSFLVHKIFAFYTKGILKFKSPDLSPEG